MRSATRAEPALDETIPAAVAATIAARPGAVAVVEPERRVTYGELGELVSRSTRAMLAAGVRRGERVAVWAPNGLGWIVAALGAQSAGAALVPINTRFKGEEAAYVLSASKAALLFTTAGFLDTNPVGMLGAVGTPLPHLRRIVLLEGSAAAGKGPEGVEVERWQAFTARAGELGASAAPERVLPTDTSDILVAVVGLPDRRMGEVPVAYVVPAPGRSVDPGALLAWARERLANYKVPRHVVALAALPINATGKVVKEALRARATADVG